MSKRYVTLGDGRHIGLGAYVAAWRSCKTLEPSTYVGRGISGHGDTAGEALRQLREGMDDRINRHDPTFGHGRKWSYQWQAETMRAASALNTPRLVVHWLPAWLKEKFSDRLFSD